jgi:MFS family permease
VAGRGRAGARPLDLILGMHGFSSFCYGMVFPFTGIYLADRPGVGTFGVAVYYAGSGVSNMLFSLVLAAGLVRVSRTVLGVSGLMLTLVCYLALPWVGSLPEAALAAAANGAGQCCFMAAIIPIVNALVPAAERRRVFALRYQILNVTLAGGSLVAALLIDALSKSVIPCLFVANALGYLPIAATLLLVARRAAARQDRPEGSRVEQDAESGGGRLPTRTLLKLTAGAAAFQFGIYFFGFSQFEATAPLVASRLMGTGLGWIPAMLITDIAIIMLAQRYVTRRLGGRSEAFGLRVTVVLWVAGFLAAGLLALGPGASRLVGLLLFAALFGLGETAYSCSFHPWLIKMVPERELTRAMALCNATMGIGTFLGPSFGVALISLGSPTGVWLPLAAGCALIGLATRSRASLRRAYAYLT